MRQTFARLWRYIPVPEPHVTGLVLGTGLQAVRPSSITRREGIADKVGVTLTALGVGMLGWSIRVMMGNLVNQRPTLVTTGPYGVSRHPMYVGWTLLYVGVAFVWNSLWHVILLPVVVGWTHSIVRREERALAREFGDDHRVYRRTVRRYL